MLRPQRGEQMLLLPLAAAAVPLPLRGALAQSAPKQVEMLASAVASAGWPSPNARFRWLLVVVASVVVVSWWPMRGSVLYPDWCLPELLSCSRPMVSMT